MNVAETIDRIVSSACPIYGVSIGNPMDKTTWKFSPRPEATTIQVAAAKAVIDGIDLVKILRRPRSKIQIKTEVMNLNPGKKQQLWDDIQAEMVADWLVENPNFATDRGINIPGDEPDV